MKNFYKSNILLAAVGALIVCLIVLATILFRDEPLIFWTSLPVLMTVSGLAVGKLIQIRKNEYCYFEQLNDTIDSSNRVALCSFPLPVALVNDNRLIVWSNESFRECFFEPDEEENSLDMVTDEPVEMFIGDGREIVYNGRTYRVYARMPQFTPDEVAQDNRKNSDIPENVDKISMLFFKDITEHKALQEEHRMSKPMVMIVMVDNYEELFNDSKESEKAYVTIQIDRLMEEYFSEMNAVLQKLTSDRFLVVVEERYVRDMIHNKVNILDKAREIKITDRTNVTLSIGIGRTAATLAESEGYARQALSMALGRGGDQAAIKTESGFHFYGAVTQGTARYSRVKTRIMADDIKMVARAADTVYIMGHSYGDFDSVGSAIGLAAAMRKMGLSAYAVVNKQMNAATPLIERFDEHKDYKEDPIVIEPAEANERFTANSLLIIVDTHIIKKLDNTELYEKVDSEHLVVIDHHRLSTGAIENAGIMWQDPNVSSTSEMVTELIQYFGVNQVIAPLEAEALLAGITLDTKDFVMRAGVSTFEAAAFLKKMGADTVSVKGLFATTMNSKAKKSEIVSSAEIYRSCAVAIVDEIFPDNRVTCSQAADEMLYISGVDASFVMYTIINGEQNGWSFSARSLGKINVQVIMESLGNKKDDGGGHSTMAGAQLYGISASEAVQKLYEAIDAYYDSLSQT